MRILNGAHMDTRSRKAAAGDGRAPPDEVKPGDRGGDALANAGAPIGETAPIGRLRTIRTIAGPPGFPTNR